MPYLLLLLNAAAVLVVVVDVARDRSNEDQGVNDAKELFVMAKGGKKILLTIRII